MFEIHFVGKLNDLYPCWQKTCSFRMFTVINAVENHVSLPSQPITGGQEVTSGMASMIPEEVRRLCTNLFRIDDSLNGVQHISGRKHLRYGRVTKTTERKKDLRLRWSDSEIHRGWSAATMSNCDHFYTQLGSIMEELANAAVAEICKLVDDGYAVLRLEMSRSHEENEALRKKVQLMELQMSQGRRKTSVAAEEPLNGGSGGARVDGGAGDGKREGKVPGKRVDSGGEPAVREEDDGEMQPIIVMESVEMENRGPQILHIKEEGPEDDEANTDTQTGVMSDTKSGTDSEHVLTLSEERQPGTVLKEDPETETLKQGVKHPAGDHGTEGIRGLDSAYLMPEKSHQATFVSQAETDLDVVDPFCSYVTESESERLLFHSKIQLVPTTKQATGADVSGVESPREKAHVLVDSLPVRETKMCAEVDRRTMTEKVQLNGLHHEDIKKTFIWSENVNYWTSVESLSHRTGKGSTVKHNNNTNCFFQNDTPSKTIKTHCRVTSAEKRFFCKYCGMGFSVPNEVEVHERRHRGEKPFSCELCGKHFTQASYLKVHQRVHTGEKPFSCKHCGKRFGQSGYLNVHQRIHTGEKPFSCTQCGKSFTRSNHLKRHQSVHIGEKLHTFKP